MQTLKEMVEHVPPELEPEVRDFVEFLLSKHRKKKLDGCNSIGGGFKGI